MADLTRRQVLATAALAGMGAVHGVAPGSTAAQTAEHPRMGADVVTDWFDFLYLVVRDARLSPPGGARLYAYAGVAGYEAVVPALPGRRSLGGQLTDLGRLPSPGSGTTAPPPTAYRPVTGC